MGAQNMKEDFVMKFRNRCSGVD